MPRENYFPPQEYWQQLTSSLEQMRVTQDSHGVLLYQIITEQESQCHELLQVRKDIGHLRRPYRAQPKEADGHCHD
ncbi:hypothetical protein AHAS_Ahas20G0182300 [Arachis hypogaea]